MTSPNQPEKQIPASSFESKLQGGATMKVRPKTKQEVALEFEVHPQTIGNWCRAVGITGRKKLSINEVLTLYKHYGWPGEYSVNLHID